MMNKLAFLLLVGCATAEAQTATERNVTVFPGHVSSFFCRGFDAGHCYACYQTKDAAQQLVTECHYFSHNRMNR